MPWKETSVMNERNLFIALAATGEVSFSELCRQFGISRKTGYKWLARAANGEDLSDHSRAPHSIPNRISPAVEELILSERTNHPKWGPRKLERTLLNKGYTDLPCKSTIGNVLKRNNRIEPEDSEAATPWKRFERDYPNDLWQMDHKGHFGMLNGNRCYPLDILDDCTRCLLCLKACESIKYEEFEPVFTRVLLEFGLPNSILCDNGKPWGDSSSGITAFDVWMMRLGVLPIHGRPLHPQTQGKLERFHRTLNNELIKRRPMRDLDDAQTAFDKWRIEYNEERPHEALDLEVPAKRYKSSKRKLEDADKPVEYDTGSRLRKVNYKGYISICRQRYYIGETLAGEFLKLSDVGEDTVSLQYGQIEFAQIDLSQQMIISRRRKRVN